MKRLFIALTFFLISTASFSGQIVSLVPKNSKLNVLSDVVGLHPAYSKTSGVEAKVIEMIAGDGVNATRMVLILIDRNSEDDGPKIFELETPINQLKRLTFSGKDQLTINYSMNSLDNMAIKDKSLQIKILRSKNGRVDDKIELNAL